MSFLRFALVMFGVVACSPTRPSDQSCVEGSLQCTGADLERCVGGTFVADQTCASVCDTRFGCVACKPDEGVCLGDTSHVCLPDGSGYTDLKCDAPGQDCDPGNGRCEAPCSVDSLANSYLGCEYYPTVTGNEVSNTFSFAIIIANYSLGDATATLEGGGMTPETFDVPPQNVIVKRLPWQPDLKLCDADQWEQCRFPTRFSARANGGAFHLTTTRPVAVYQFSPLDYETTGATEFSYTNDASLLFPINVWGTSYRVASWRETNSSPGLMTIVGGQDGTTVTIMPSASTQGDATAPTLTQGVGQTVTLNHGDVLEVGTVAAGDLTGSLVTSDKPVEVIGGHYCANVPMGTSYCDHLEESMIPIRALSNKYLVTPPRSDTFPNGRIEVVRVIATEPDTELVFDPPQTGVNTTLQLAGDFVELASTAASFQVSANAKILVAQYMIGQSATSGTSDPAMTIGVPVGQYRSSYMFHAPTNYAVNYLDVTAPSGTALKLDGMPAATTSTPIGSSGFSLTRFTLDHGIAGNGNHQIEGDQAFGITVYGYGDYTSYWYPGGLDLAPIIQ